MIFKVHINSMFSNIKRFLLSRLGLVRDALMAGGTFWKREMTSEWAELQRNESLNASKVDDLSYLECEHNREYIKNPPQIGSSTDIYLHLVVKHYGCYACHVESKLTSC